MAQVLSHGVLTLLEKQQSSAKAVLQCVVLYLHTVFTTVTWLQFLRVEEP